MTQINTLHDTVRDLQRSFHSFFPCIYYLSFGHYKCTISQHSLLAFLYILPIIVQYFQRHQNQRFLCTKPVMHYLLHVIVISKLMMPFLGVQSRKMRRSQVWTIG